MRQLHRLLLPSHSQARLIGNSFFINRTSNVISNAVDKLADTVQLSQDQLITQSRHKFQLMKTSPESLSERLQRSQAVRQRVIPSSITVDKSRQYIEFVWPSGLTDDVVADLVGLGPATDQEPSCRQRPVRTRVLAELLRVHTPSTDGSYASSNVLIYGRRGITIVDMYAIGNYAVRISFSDGHTGGIYNFEFLYYLSCPENKYRLMRDYVRQLRAKRKSRDPPQRRPSQRHRAPPV